MSDDNEEALGLDPSAGRKKSTKKQPKSDSPKKQAKVKVPESDEKPESKGPPTDIMPLFLSTKSQQIFQCITDEDVTEDNPFKSILKKDILEDMMLRAAISDFHPAKKIVQDYPGEELLVVYDPDFKYGQNFYLCMTEEARFRLLRPVSTAEGSAPEGEGEAVEEEEMTYTYKPPEAKEWISLGSENEINEEVVRDTRERIKFMASRVRREFGAPITFTDRHCNHVTAGDEGLSATYLECLSYEDKNFATERMEQETSTQAVPELTEGSSQTEWKHPRNATIQYVPRKIPKENSKQVQAEEEFKTFISDVAPRFELALQQNEIMNVFFDDWVVLGEEDTNFGNKSDSHLKEYQSFTDLEYSKDKTVTCIDWHPTIKGIMAVSCCERLTFDERVEKTNQLLMMKSLILVWSFSDPIHPQLLLEAPDDMYCFKFCPTDPNIVAGGCINGQLVLWDLSEHSDRLHSRTIGHSKSTQKQRVMFGEEVGPETPIVRYCAVSAIENSHRSVITCLEWIPDHFEINRLGVPVDNKLQECVQIMTSSPDQSVMIWDTRPPKAVGPSRDQDKSFIPLGVPQTFKHLDLKWKPLLKINLQKTDASGEYSPLLFSLKERQGVRDHVPPPDISLRRESVAVARGNSAKNQKPLEGVSSEFFIGSEDGEIVFASFKFEKDNETGKAIVPKPSWSVAPHDGPVVALQRSPFFSDILLGVGGWTFAIWKEGVKGGAIIQSACAIKQYTAGHWSTTRPAVFFLGLKNGNVEVWDLLDRTHEPSLVQNVTAAEVTYIVPWVVSKKQHLIAVSDNLGTLHILEIPWNLRHPSVSEKASVQSYFDRETNRIEYFHKRVQYHENARRDLEMKGKDKEQEKLEDKSEEVLLEVYGKMYTEYLELEKKLLQELGIVDEEADI